MLKIVAIKAIEDGFSVFFLLIFLVRKSDGEKLSFFADVFIVDD